MEPIALRNQLRAKGMNLSVLADRLGLNKSSVSRWDRNGVPLERVADVENVTGIPRHKLRPDFFGPAPERQSA